jgi:hypothetical protein
MKAQCMCFSKIARVLLMLSTLILAAFYTSNASADICPDNQYHSVFYGCRTPEASNPYLKYKFLSTVGSDRCITTPRGVRCAPNQQGY